MDVSPLVAEAKAGDREALISLIMDQKQEYYKLAYAYMGNRDDALDAVSEMALILWDNIHKLKDNTLFYSWSKTILVNCCRKMLKKRKRFVPLSDAKKETYKESYEAREQRLDIHQYLTRLNRDQQEAIKLHYYLDWDYQTISEITQVPLGTVKSRISTGLRKLRHFLGGEYA